MTLKFPSDGQEPALIRMLQALNSMAFYFVFDAQFISTTYKNVKTTLILIYLKTVFVIWLLYCILSFF